MTVKRHEIVTIRLNCHIFQLLCAVLCSLSTSITESPKIQNIINFVSYYPLGNLNSRRSPGKQSSLEAAVPTSSRRHFNYHFAQTTLLFQISNTKKEEVD